MVHGPSGSSGEEERWDHRPAWAFKNGKPLVGKGATVEAVRRDNNLQPVSTALFMKVAVESGRSR